MKTRNQIEDKYKWDLTPFCKSEKEFEEKISKLKSMIAEAGKFEGKLNDKKVLWEYLEFSRKFNELIEPIAFYVFNMKNIDLSNTDYQVKAEKINILFTNYSQALSYVQAEMAKFSDKYYDELISDKKFKDYDYTFKLLKKHKKHFLSKGDAKIISGMNFVDFGESHSLFADAGLKYPDAVDKNGKKYELNETTRGIYLQSKDSVLRKSAAKNTLVAYGQFIDFLTANYLNEVKKEVFISKVEKYDSTLQNYFEEEDVSKKIYDMLLKKVCENIPVINEFFKHKKRILGLSTLNNYDISVPISKISEKKYTFEDGYKLVEEALKVLGKDYVDVLEQAKNEHWIDVMPSKNKATGAYSNSIYGFYPVALLNFNGNYNSVSTIAHEMGHSMQSYLSNKTQCREKASYPIFLAEIASTTNELLLMHHLLKTLPQKDKKGLYDDFFVEIHNTIFRQMMFSEFEKYVIEAVEKDESLDRKQLCDKYFSLCKKYMPSLKLLDELKYEWARIPHFYRGFYVYKYAVGMICALNFSGRIIAGEKGAVEKYLKFLSAGGSKSPNEILKDAGCDLEKEETYDKAFAVVKEFLKEYK